MIEVGDLIIYYYDDGSHWLAQVREIPKQGMSLVFQVLHESCPGGTQLRNDVARATDLADALNGLEKWSTIAELKSWTNANVLSDGTINPFDFL